MVGSWNHFDFWPIWSTFNEGYTVNAVAVGFHTQKHHPFRIFPAYTMHTRIESTMIISLWAMEPNSGSSFSLKLWQQSSTFLPRSIPFIAVSPSMFTGLPGRMWWRTYSWLAENLHQFDIGKDGIFHGRCRRNFYGFLLSTVFLEYFHVYQPTVGWFGVAFFVQTTSRRPQAFTIGRVALPHDIHIYNLTNTQCVQKISEEPDYAKHWFLDSLVAGLFDWGVIDLFDFNRFGWLVGWFDGWIDWMDYKLTTDLLIKWLTEGGKERKIKQALMGEASQLVFQSFFFVKSSGSKTTSQTQTASSLPIEKTNPFGFLPCICSFGSIWKISVQQLHVD